MGIRYMDSEPRKRGNWSDVFFFLVLVSVLVLFVLGIKEEQNRATPEYKKRAAESAGYQAAQLQKAFDEGYKKGLK